MEEDKVGISNKQLINISEEENSENVAGTMSEKAIAEQVPEE